MMQNGLFGNDMLATLPRPGPQLLCLLKEPHCLPEICQYYHESDFNLTQNGPCPAQTFQWLLNAYEIRVT